MCSCPDEYLGKYCENNNPCSSIPCYNNGKCEINEFNIEKFNCICPADFTGRYCENRLTNITSCQNDTCLNNGICFRDRDTNTYKCSCKLPYYGLNCEKKLYSSDTNKTTTTTTTKTDMTTSTQPPCIDKDIIKCKYYTRMDMCSNYYLIDGESVASYCAKSCDRCELQVCDDSQPVCEKWAQLDLCNKIGSKVEKNKHPCKKSCGYC
jgi:hypothetical protein